jgi:lysophospholipase L1-like esterase
MGRCMVAALLGVLILASACSSDPGTGKSKGTSGTGSGGAASGGAASGGAASGGAASGGAASGGAASGGAASGGAASGGAASGGAASGGAASGGAASGGAASGGAASGGAASGGAASGGAGGGEEPSVRFVGRFELSDQNGPQFEWSGSEMQARFSGTELSVRLAGASNFFASVIDGTMTKIEFTGGEQLLPLATELAEGEHEVRLSRITEAYFWSTQFLGFELGSGTLLPPPPDPGRRLEVIGDSITAGYGNEGESSSCSFSADTENHYLTYEALAARELQADLVTLAWSGIGMYRNSGGDMASLRMPERYLRTMPDFEPLWDFSRYVPHVVVIALGTNDFSTGDPGAPFEQAYADFVAELRGRYPEAFVYLANSPMLDSTQQATLAGYLQTLITEREGLGDQRIKLLPFATQLASDGIGCDWHPNLVTHQKMADLLVAAIREDLGW